MNKNIILIAVGILVLVIILAIFVSSRSAPVVQVSSSPINAPILLPTGGTKTPTPTPSLKPIPTGATIPITTDKGVVSVKNFYNNKPQMNAQNDAAVDTKASFQIVYFNRYNSFLITLLSKPLAQARTQAETALLKDLGISRAQACMLNISLSVPYDVDQNVSGKELGLSFCPGSVVL